MKKIIVALAAIAMTAGLSVNAQNEQSSQQMQNCPRMECAQQSRDCAFEGLSLTDSQKEQLKALAQKRMSSNKDKKQAQKENRNTEKRAFLADVKTILTPEQYIQFLENSFVNQGKFAKNRKTPQMRHPHGQAARMTPQNCPQTSHANK